MTRLFAATLALAAGTAVARAGEPARLRGAVPAATARLAPAGAAPADLPLEYVTVVLGLRDRDALEATIAAQQDRRSPRFGQWLEAPEIADRFGPTREEYARVRRWFRARGFDIVRESPHRTLLAVAGTAAQAEATFKTPIRLFRSGGRIFHAPLLEPALPASVREAVRAVVGLDDLPKFRPLVELGAGTFGCEAGVPCVTLGPADFAAAYDVTALQTTGLTGAGRSVAIVARSNYPDADVALFNERFLAAPRPLPVRHLAGRDPGIAADPGERLEILIDTQWGGALAPGAAVNVVIGTPRGDLFEALVKAVDDRLGDVISISFGLCESASTLLAEVFDAVYSIANAQGQTVLVASGDFGASDCLASQPPSTGLAVNGLASSPHAVAVGGTSFALADDGTVPADLRERVWNDGVFGGGGGESLLFARPAYQLGPGVPPSTGRLLPDVAVAADPSLPGYVVVEAGANRLAGGTSVGAPALAGVLALLSEQQGRQGLGQLLPSIYRAGAEQTRGLRAPVFRDVVEGTNQVEASGGHAAGPGFDLASGWGAPLGTALGGALSSPGPCEGEVACLVPAPGPRRRACAGEWLVEHERLALRRNGLPRVRQRCRDGDPACDADGTVDGRCTIDVALCLNVFDFRVLNRRGLPVCSRRTIRGVSLLRPRRAAADPLAAATARALTVALGALPQLPTRLRSACTAAVPVVVPVSPRGRGGTTLRARVHSSRGPASPRVTLRCDG
jgi:hypothetical protein